MVGSGGLADCFALGAGFVGVECCGGSCGEGCVLAVFACSSFGCCFGLGALGADGACGVADVFGEWAVSGSVFVVDLVDCGDEVIDVECVFFEESSPCACEVCGEGWEVWVEVVAGLVYGCGDLGVVGCGGHELIAFSWLGSSARVSKMAALWAVLFS